MYVEPALVTDSQAAEAVEPGKGSLDHPAVTPQLRAALDATPRDTRYDAPLAQRRPVALRVVPFVSMQLHRTIAASSSMALPPDISDSINHALQLSGVSYFGSFIFY